MIKNLVARTGVIIRFRELLGLWSGLSTTAKIKIRTSENTDAIERPYSVYSPSSKVLDLKKFVAPGQKVALLKRIPGEQLSLSKHTVFCLLGPWPAYQV